MIAHVSAIFLLLGFEQLVIIKDFRAIAHSISAWEGGNTVCWNAMVRNRTDDDSLTYWFSWKHPMARRRGLEFGVLDQTPQKNGLVCSAPRASPLDLLSSTKLPQPKHRLGPSGLAIHLSRRLYTKTQPTCGFGPAGLAFRASQMHQAPIFRPFYVHLAVSNMLRSTPTTPSVLIS